MKARRFRWHHLLLEIYQYKTVHISHLQLMSTNNTQHIEDKLLRHKKCIESSSLYNDTIELLEPLKFDRIRCLALGSPCEEFQALYQLALLELIIEKFKIQANLISIYDPAFTENDISLFEGKEFIVESTCEWDSRSTLFFMPHAPRSMTEILLNEKKPLWVLGNDSSVTIGTLSSAKFLEKYPTLATIVHLYERKTPQRKPEDNFKVVTGRRRKSKQNKLVYVAPELIYDTDGMYFNDIEITRIASPENPIWNDSFSDFALNVFSCKDERLSGSTGVVHDKGKDNENNNHENEE